MAIFSKITYGLLVKFEFQIIGLTSPRIDMSHAVSPRKVCCSCEMQI